MKLEEAMRQARERLRAAQRTPPTRLLWLQAPTAAPHQRRQRQQCAWLGAVGMSVVVPCCDLKHPGGLAHTEKPCGCYTPVPSAESATLTSARRWRYVALVVDLQQRQDLGHVRQHHTGPQHGERYAAQPHASAQLNRTLAPHFYAREVSFTCVL